MRDSCPSENISPKVCPAAGKVLEDIPENISENISAKRRRIPFLVVAYWISGFLALVWFLVRVIPKPSRAAYPCQRLAFPVASSFILWLVGFAGSIVAFRKAGRLLGQARYIVAGLCAVAGIGAACWTLSLTGEPASAAFVPADPPNSPIGIGKGIHPGRVVWVHEPNATNWDGTSNYWWSDQNTDQALVDQMMAASIRKLAGEESDAGAWDAIFHHFNQTHGRGDAGYQGGERIAIKINMNVAGDYSLTNEPIASPQAVLALLRQLVHQAGVTESAITVYDASRCITSAIYNPCHQEYPAVQFVDKQGSGRIQATPDTTVAVHFADSRVNYSGSTRLPQCVVQADYLINMALLRGHSLAGVTLCAKNHFGSVWRNGTFSPDHIHPSVSRGQSMGSVNSLVDLMGHEHLGGKTLLFMVEALYAANNQSSSYPARWRMSPFSGSLVGDWTSSLFVSQDGVAMDSVAVDFCRSEPTLANPVTGSGVDNYLHEAALAGNPPSGSAYDPEGDGTTLESLGVHEHWNNAIEKQYTRNLGTGEGIELVLVTGVGSFQRGDSNTDGSIDLSDVIATLFQLFVFGGEPECASSLDADDSGELDISDATYLLSYLFIGGDEPPPPFGICGGDPTDDLLTCLNFPPCALEARAPTLLVSGQSPAKILIPQDGSLALTWIEGGFQDDGWIDGKAAVGYDENPDYDPFIITDVEAEMNDKNTTAYIRIPFTVEEPLVLEKLILWMQYDDGFTAYLNGGKVAERNAPANPRWDSMASTDNPDGQASSFEEMDITEFADLIVVGENLLAIHGLNYQLTSSDFLIVPELEVRTP